MPADNPILDQLNNQPIAEFHQFNTLIKFTKPFTKRGNLPTTQPLPLPKRV